MQRNLQTNISIVIEITYFADTIIYIHIKTQSTCELKVQANVMSHLKLIFSELTQN